MTTSGAAAAGARGSRRSPIEMLASLTGLQPHASPASPRPPFAAAAGSLALGSRADGPLTGARHREPDG